MRVSPRRARLQEQHDEKADGRVCEGSEKHRHLLTRGILRLKKKEKRKAAAVNLCFLHVPIAIIGISADGAVIEHLEPPHTAAEIQLCEDLTAPDGRCVDDTDVIVVAACYQEVVGQWEDGRHAGLVSFAVRPEGRGGRRGRLRIVVGVGVGVQGESQGLQDCIVAAGEEVGGVGGEG